MRVWVPRLGSKVAVDIDGDVVRFAMSGKDWAFRIVDGEAVDTLDRVATPKQKGDARGLAEKAWREAKDREALSKTG